MVVFVTKMFYTYWNHCKYQAVHNFLYIFLNMIFNIILHSYILRNCVFFTEKSSLPCIRLHTIMVWNLYIIIPKSKLERHILHFSWICFYLIILIFFITFLYITGFLCATFVSLPKGRPFQVTYQIQTLCED